MRKILIILVHLKGHFQVAAPRSTPQLRSVIAACLSLVLLNPGPSFPAWTLNANPQRLSAETVSSQALSPAIEMMRKPYVLFSAVAVLNALAITYIKFFGQPSDPVVNSLYVFATNVALLLGIHLPDSPQDPPDDKSHVLITRLRELQNLLDQPSSDFDRCYTQVKTLLPREIVEQIERTIGNIDPTVALTALQIRDISKTDALPTILLIGAIILEELNSDQPLAPRVYEELKSTIEAYNQSSRGLYGAWSTPWLFSFLVSDYAQNTKRIRSWIESFDRLPTSLRDDVFLFHFLQNGLHYDPYSRESFDTLLSEDLLEKALTRSQEADPNDYRWKWAVALNLVNRRTPRMKFTAKKFGLPTILQWLKEIQELDSANSAPVAALRPSLGISWAQYKLPLPIDQILFHSSNPENQAILKIILSRQTVIENTLPDHFDTLTQVWGTLSSRRQLYQDAINDLSADSRSNLPSSHMAAVGFLIGASTAWWNLFSADHQTPKLWQQSFSPILIGFFFAPIWQRLNAWLARMVSGNRKLLTSQAAYSVLDDVQLIRSIVDNFEEKSRDVDPNASKMLKACAQSALSAYQEKWAPERYPSLLKYSLLAMAAVEPDKERKQRAAFLAAQVSSSIPDQNEKSVIEVLTLFWHLRTTRPHQELPVQIALSANGSQGYLVFNRHTILEREVRINDKLWTLQRNKVGLPYYEKTVSDAEPPTSHGTGAGHGLPMIFALLALAAGPLNAYPLPMDLDGEALRLAQDSLLSIFIIGSLVPLVILVIVVLTYKALKPGVTYREALELAIEQGNPDLTKRFYEEKDSAEAMAAKEHARVYLDFINSFREDPTAVNWDTLLKWRKQNPKAPHLNVDILPERVKKAVVQHLITHGEAAPNTYEALRALFRDWPPGTLLPSSEPSAYPSGIGKFLFIGALVAVLVALMGIIVYDMVFGSSPLSFIPSVTGYMASVPVVMLLLEKYRRAPASFVESLDSKSQQIFQMIRRGYSLKTIKDILDLPERTAVFAEWISATLASWLELKKHSASWYAQGKYPHAFAEVARAELLARSNLTETALTHESHLKTLRISQGDGSAESLAEFQATLLQELNRLLSPSQSAAWSNAEVVALSRALAVKGAPVIHRLLDSPQAKNLASGLAALIAHDIETLTQEGVPPHIAAALLPFMSPEEFLLWGKSEGTYTERANRAREAWGRLHGTRLDSLREPTPPNGIQTLTLMAVLAFVITAVAVGFLTPHAAIASADSGAGLWSVAVLGLFAPKPTLEAAQNPLKNAPWLATTLRRLLKESSFIETLKPSKLTSETLQQLETLLSRDNRQQLIRDIGLKATDDESSIFEFLKSCEHRLNFGEPFDIVMMSIPLLSLKDVAHTFLLNPRFPDDFKEDIHKALREKGYTAALMAGRVLIQSASSKEAREQMSGILAAVIEEALSRTLARSEYSDAFDPALREPLFDAVRKIPFAAARIDLGHLDPPDNFEPLPMPNNTTRDSFLREVLARPELTKDSTPIERGILMMHFQWDVRQKLGYSASRYRRLGSREAAIFFLSRYIEVSLEELSALLQLLESATCDTKPERRLRREASEPSVLNTKRAVPFLGYEKFFEITEEIGNQFSPADMEILYTLLEQARKKILPLRHTRTREFPDVAKLLDFYSRSNLLDYWLMLLRQAFDEQPELVPGLVRSLKAFAAEHYAAILYSLTLAYRDPRDHDLYKLSGIDEVLRIRDDPTLFLKWTHHLKKSEKLLRRHWSSLISLLSSMNGNVFLFRRAFGDEGGLVIFQQIGRWFMGFFELNNGNAFFAKYPPDGRDFTLHRLFQSILASALENPFMPRVLSNINTLIDTVTEKKKYPITVKVPVNGYTVRMPGYQRLGDTAHYEVPPFAGIENDGAFTVLYRWVNGKWEQMTNPPQPNEFMRFETTLSAAAMMHEGVPTGQVADMFAVMDEAVANQKADPSSRKHVTQLEEMVINVVMGEFGSIFVPKEGSASIILKQVAARLPPEIKALFDFTGNPHERRSLGLGGKFPLKPLRSAA